MAPASHPAPGTGDAADPGSHLADGDHPLEDPPRDDETMTRGYARMRAKDDAARAQLEPLGPNERPLAVTLCALLAAAVAFGNVLLIVFGWELEGVTNPSLVQSLAPAALMLVCAAGLWRRQYWALLAFQVVLTITILFAFLFLLRASNLQAVALCMGILGVSGTLFWFLVKAMARTQMPRDASIR